jgi:hypothetical protein
MAKKKRKHDEEQANRKSAPRYAQPFQGVVLREGGNVFDESNGSPKDGRAESQYSFIERPRTLTSGIN